MKKVLIIEDERLSADRLRRLLSDIDDTLEVEGPLETVEAVVSTLKNHNDFHLIFSDIRLRDRLVFEAFREIMPKCMVIFTTAYDEYALTAFRNNGIGYLLKPIDIDELTDAIKKVDLLESAPQKIDKSINACARELKSFRERILVSRGDELIPLKVEGISYIRIESDQVMAYVGSGEGFRLSMSMNELEEQLNPDEFFRLNRQYIVRFSAIKKISYFFRSKLIVRLFACDDDQIVVSKEKSSQFKQWLDR